MEIRDPQADWWSEANDFVVKWTDRGWNELCRQKVPVPERRQLDIALSLFMLDHEYRAKQKSNHELRKKLIAAQEHINIARDQLRSLIEPLNATGCDSDAISEQMRILGKFNAEKIHDCLLACRSRRDRSIYYKLAIRLDEIMLLKRSRPYIDFLDFILKTVAPFVRKYMLDFLLCEADHATHIEREIRGQCSETLIREATRLRTQARLGK